MNRTIQIDLPLQQFPLNCGEVKVWSIQIEYKYVHNTVNVFRSIPSLQSQNTSTVFTHLSMQITQNKNSLNREFANDPIIIQYTMEQLFVLDNCVTVVVLSICVLMNACVGLCSVHVWIVSLYFKVQTSNNSNIWHHICCLLYVMSIMQMLLCTMELNGSRKMFT